MYYVIEIAQGDSKIAGKGIYEYLTQKEAIASFHKKIGTAMSSDLYTSDILLVISYDGIVVERYAYFAENDSIEEESTEVK